MNLGSMFLFMPVIVPIDMLKERLLIKREQRCSFLNLHYNCIIRNKTESSPQLLLLEIIAKKYFAVAEITCWSHLDGRFEMTVEANISLHLVTFL